MTSPLLDKSKAFALRIIKEKPEISASIVFAKKKTKRTSERMSFSFCRNRGGGISLYLKFSRTTKVLLQTELGTAIMVDSNF